MQSLSPHKGRENFIIERAQNFKKNGMLPIKNGLNWGCETVRFKGSNRKKKEHNAQNLDLSTKTLKLKGRYMKVEKGNSYCKLCTTGDIGDELDFYLIATNFTNHDQVFLTTQFYRIINGGVGSGRLPPR